MNVIGHSKGMRLVSHPFSIGLRTKRGEAAGVTAGNWLLKDQANQLLNAPDPATLKGKRDRAILALLICCGLRRAEVLGLEVGSIQQRDGRWVIPDLVGKGNRLRMVTVPTKSASVAGPLEFDTTTV